MDHSPMFHDKGTRFTNYSSIHSADAFIGEYQVMYTPGSTSPQQAKANRKSTRFGRNVSSSKPQQNVSQSYLLPSNMPNTSQIMPDHGPLPNIQVHYNIPADEKQIVASLRALQRDLAEAMETITSLTRERDDAIQELRMVKVSQRRASSPPARKSRDIDEELFDLSSPLHESPKRSHRPKSKKEGEDNRETQISDEARVISARAARDSAAQEKRVASKVGHDLHKQARKSAMEDTEKSMEENPTAASNTSRRRRKNSMDENMTSAFFMEDITIDRQIQSPVRVSKEAQNVLHSLDPEHISNCDVCHRLTRHIQASERERERKSSARSASQPKPTPAEPASKVQDFAPDLTAGKARRTPQPDYTAVMAGFPADESYVGDATMRPKVAPAHAMARVKMLMDEQFRKAKERHGLAWEKYNRIEAPLSSRKHSEISKEMQHWAEKMEELRIHLDYLRDVEEGMINDE